MTSSILQRCFWVSLLLFLSASVGRAQTAAQEACPSPKYDLAFKRLFLHDLQRRRKFSKKDQNLSKSLSKKDQRLFKAAGVSKEIWRLWPGDEIFGMDRSGRLDWALREPTGQLTPHVMKALPQPDVVLDGLSPAVKYLRWRDADLYFFFNESTEKQSRRAVLVGSGRAQVWEVATGRIEPLAGAAAEKGAMSLPLTLEPYERKFIIIGPTLPAGAASVRLRH